MRKLLDWEKTVEAQRKKQFWLWSLALVGWAAALGAIWWIGEILYGEIVETGVFSFIGASIGISIALGLRKAMGKEDEPSTKKEKWVSGIVIVVSLGVLVWMAVCHGMVVYLTEFIFLLPILFWSDYEKKKEIDRISMYACTVLLASVLLVAGTLTGTKMMGLTSTYGAKKTIGAEGFTDVEYVCWMYGRWLNQFAEDTSFYEENMGEEKFYLFSGEKDGEAWRIVIDPKGGDILLAATEGEEPELANWI